MTTSQKLKVIFFVRRVGPYHHARFEAAAKVVDLTVVETRSDSQEYPWEFSASGSYAIESFTETNSNFKSSTPGLFRKHSPDVIVTTGWADPEYHAAVLEAHRNNIPCVVISDSRYEDVPRKSYTEFPKKLILKSYSSAIVAGTASRNYLVKLGFKNDSIFSPWDVVDNNYFSDVAHHSDIIFSHRYFLCVSRFIAKKNLFELIDAFNDYVNRDGKRDLVIAGSGELETQLKEKVNALSLNNRITFPGFAQYDEVKKIYQQAYSLIIPSLSDQWGLVVNEAMASGLPVLVSSACGCAIDLVKDNQNGRIFDPLDRASILEAIVQIGSLTEEEWKQMGNKGLEIISKYQPSDFAGALLDACKFAIAHMSTTSYSFIHKLLAR